MRRFFKAKSDSPLADQSVVQLKSEQDPQTISHPRPQSKNPQSLPEPLKSGVESLSGYSMDEVEVHHNSDQPKALGAHAYAQGNEIHLGPGQEKHLPHEAWHVVQQAQGQVKPQKQFKSGLAINEDAALEREADQMGAKATQKSSKQTASNPLKPLAPSKVVQRFVDVRTLKYKKEGTLDFEWSKSGYLEKFYQVQVFLADLGRTKPHLDKLNERLLNLNPNLSNLLSMMMPEWESNVLILVGPAPRASFSEMVEAGQIFEDYVDGITSVGLAHGVQSHRLQWYLIKQEFGGIAHELYKESVNEVWLHDEKPELTMWDRIVDGSTNDPHDFTQPGKLQRYLTKEYEAPEGQANHLSENLRNEELTFTNTLKKFNALKGTQLADGSAPMPHQPSVDAEGNTWKGWIRDSEGQPWAPSMMQRPESLERAHETHSIALDGQETNVDQLDTSLVDIGEGFDFNQAQLK